MKDHNTSPDIAWDRRMHHIEVVWEPVVDEDTQDALLQAFEMIFTDDALFIKGRSKAYQGAKNQRDRMPGTKSPTR